ncbi:hypothetical protein J0895_18370 [Phormidium pseudopriestleyi FRX01]|uniref:Uncharacterized protein n=1 Tax=Phormidium pseudopriestleyi FRX01 TaxID=1759528 RepID=A0ABS3FXC0_9CYAN|nr:hypothetical protein [Phormidium pseudopriestleyi]MBO0350997.1 hypothetical protein [Phormidium pseudopriestleyi FRX01]
MDIKTRTDRHCFIPSIAGPGLPWVLNPKVSPTADYFFTWRKLRGFGRVGTSWGQFGIECDRRTPKKFGPKF